MTQPPMTMLEKAARAVHAKLVEGAVHCPDFDAVVASEHEIIYEVTRAVLMAIREPDGAVAEAGCRADDPLGELTDWRGSDVTTREAVAGVFIAMIDQILSEGAKA